MIKLLQLADHMLSIYQRRMIDDHGRILTKGPKDHRYTEEKEQPPERNVVVFHG
jgi:hypothetical protein